MSGSLVKEDGMSQALRPGLKVVKALWIAITAAVALASVLLWPEWNRSCWIARLTYPNVEVRLQALHALRFKTETDGRVIDLILVAASDKDAVVRERVAWILGEVGYKAHSVDCGVIGVEDPPIRHEDRQKVVFALQVLILDEEDSVRDTAAYSLATCGPAGIAPALSLLGSVRREVRCAALRALGMGWQKDRRIVPPQDATALADELRKQVEDSDSEIRQLAIRAIGLLDFGPAEVRILVPVLIRSLNEDDAEVRANAAFAFRNFAGRRNETQFGIGFGLSGEAELAVTALSEIAQTDRSGLADQALKALGRPTPE